MGAPVFWQPGREIGIEALELEGWKLETVTQGRVVPEDPVPRESIYFGSYQNFGELHFTSASGKAAPANRRRELVPQTAIRDYPCNRRLTRTPQ